MQAVDLPSAIFTGEGLDTVATFQKVIDAIKIGPKEAKFTKQQLAGMTDILSAMIKVAESNGIDAICFSAKSDLYVTLDITLNGRNGWDTIQRIAASEAGLVPVSMVVAFLKGEAR